MSRTRRSFRVQGRVQGVGFRAATRDCAVAIGGLAGTVRNLEEGDVFVEVEGASEAVEALRAFLHEGPRFARVDSVTEEAPGQSALHAPFQIAV